MAKIALLMDDIHQCNPLKDTSLALGKAAQKRQHQLYYIESNQLHFHNSQTPNVNALVHSLRLHDSTTDWFTLGEPEQRPLTDFDVVLLRSDPPFDLNYLYRTQLLDIAASQGVLVLNNPTAVRSFNEKLFTLQFPDYLAPTLVTRDIGQLKQFLKQQQKIVIKPLDSMGGDGVLVIEQSDINQTVMFEMSTQNQQRLIMAQRYLSEISDGDKRILIIDGEVIPYALARIPQSGESRGNLAAGGKGIVQPLNNHELTIAQHIAEICKQQNLFFVGLDMIGQVVTEINVTSPTCLIEIETASNIPLAKKTIQAIEKKLR